MYSFFSFSRVGNTTAGITHLDTFRGDFDPTQTIPLPTLQATTACDALYFSVDVSLGCPRAGVPRCGPSRCLAHQDPVVFAPHSPIMKRYFSGELWR